MRKWTKEEIISVLSDFYAANDHMPTAKELDNTVGLPKRKTIRDVLDMTYKELIDCYFPEAEYKRGNRYNECNNERYIDDFIKRYVELGKPIQTEYDSNRNIGSPRSKYIMKIAGVSTWNKLLEKYNLVDEKNKFKVVIDCDFRNLDKITEITEKINKILQETY